MMSQVLSSRTACRLSGDFNDLNFGGRYASLLFSVTEIRAVMAKSMPPLLVLNVAGVAPSSGWSCPTLAPAMYDTVPKDGIWDFDLLAEPPDDYGATMLVPITANLAIPLPPWCRGVRIRASTNEMKHVFSKNGLSASIESGHSDSGPGDAFPWLISEEAIALATTSNAELVERMARQQGPGLTVDSLIGMKVRVVPRGVMVTQEYDPRRVTFLLDENARIERSAIG